MIAECIYGPKDGEMVVLQDSFEIGRVHGVMMAHSAEYHPFSKEEALIDIALPEKRPAFVALYRLAPGSRLEFMCYVKRGRR